MCESMPRIVLFRILSGAFDILGPLRDAPPFALSDLYFSRITFLSPVIIASLEFTIITDLPRRDCFAAYAAIRPRIPSVASIIISLFILGF